MEKDLHEEVLVTEKKGPQKSFSTKIICLGDCSVGKTSIICRYVQNRFKLENQSTLGVEYFRKEISLDNQRILLEIWDTAGQERYRSLVKFFYKNAKGALIVFDLCDHQSFQNVDFWLRSLRVNSEREVVIFVIGNKCDMPEKRMVKEQEIWEFCKANQLEYFETSAKDGTLIEDVFLELARRIREKYKDSESFINNSVSSDISDLKRERGCTICEC